MMAGEVVLVKKLSLARISFITNLAYTPQGSKEITSWNKYLQKHYRNGWIIIQFSQSPTTLHYNTTFTVVSKHCTFRTVIQLFDWSNLQMETQSLPLGASFCPCGQFGPRTVRVPVAVTLTPNQLYIAQVYTPLSPALL